MRTLKEQEYQCTALKYRSLSSFYELLLEIIVSCGLTYVMLLWHWVPAGLVGAWGIMSTIKCFTKWQRHAREYRNFQADFDAMMFRNRTRAFLDKINKAVEDGEKELSRMEQEMRDDEIQH